MILTRKECFFVVDRVQQVVHKCLSASTVFYGVGTFSQIGVTFEMCNTEIILRAELYELKKYGSVR